MACILGSCRFFYDREKLVDKTKLTASDYRIFQGTPAWDLAKAVEDGDKDKIRKIVNGNPQLINYQDPTYGRTLLMLTVTNQQMKSFKTLLELNADVNIHDEGWGRFALIEACSFNAYSIKFVKLLIEHGAKVNDVETGKGKNGLSGTDAKITPLIQASRSNFLEAVKLLISENADINYVSNRKQTALGGSIIQDNYKVAYYLLEHGADYTLPIMYLFDYSKPDAEEGNIEDQRRINIA